MKAVITGDIIASRKLVNQEKWLEPLKNLFNTWGERPRDWELVRGDSFQIELSEPENALIKALEIKALIKKIKSFDKQKTISPIDVRMAIGIGEKNYSGETISESNGSAFVYSGEKYDLLKKENITLGIKTSSKELDYEMNLYLKLACLFMDKWTISSAELVHIILNNPELKQEEIGDKLGIKQNSVSNRWNRANINEMFAVNKMYVNKIKTLKALFE